MASRSVHISDYAAALDDGTFPGKFDEDRHAYLFPFVETAGAHGARLLWGVEVRLYEDGKETPFKDEYLSSEPIPAGLFAEITTTSFQVSAAGVRGKTRAGGKPTIVRTGKNLGKANATNAVTQALRDALGKYNAKLKQGTAVERDAFENGDAGDAGDADNAGAGAPPRARACRPASARNVHQPPPMLVKKIGETRDATLSPEVFARGVTVQPKFNGVRAPIYLRDGRVHMYSRTSGDYPGLTHIRRELADALSNPPPVPDEFLIPPPGCGAVSSENELDDEELARLREVYAGDHVHLDGEVYLHGKSLRWISGQARREDDESTLEYMVFDCFFPAAKAAGHDMASAHRQAYIDLFFAAGGPFVHVKRAENFPVASLAEVEALRDRFLAEGYEGAIARKDCAGYQYSISGLHSACLVKIKPKFDSEFEVVGFTQGEKGKDVGAVIWVAKVDPEHIKDPEDATFNVVPKDMSYEERYRVFRCLSQEVADDRPGARPRARVTRFARDFLGRPLTVEYPERSTKTGKPTQAKALAFRTYEGGPAADPIRRLYTECE